MRTVKTPSGTRYTLFSDMIEEPHLLIAGATGSGKSVLVNGLISTMLFDGPGRRQLILVDPKRVELSEYRTLPHTLIYADSPESMIQALRSALDLVEKRYRIMQLRREKLFSGPDVYVIIDELADLMTTARRQVEPLIQRLCQIGRAARVHVIACTQCPLSAVIPTPIKVNFDARVGLRTATRQDSRNILGAGGCELLPDPRTEGRAQALYRHGSNLDLWNLPYVQDAERARLVDWWTKQKGFFARFRSA